MQYIFQKPRIQIQHLLKLNFFFLYTSILFHVIQIQHLLKLNRCMLQPIVSSLAIQIQHLLKLNIRNHCESFETDCEFKYNTC